jgi:ubiquinone/menaquinone biosynthesis C-methylase UbiE
MNPAEFLNIAALEENFWWFAGMRQITDSLLNSIPQMENGSHVLEVGCGTGYMARYLERRYGFQVHCLDLASEGLAYAQSAGTARLVQGDMRYLPYRSGSFAAVFSFDALVHLERKNEGLALHEFARVLKPAGLLLVRVSALDILRSRHSIFAHERQRFTRKRLAASLCNAAFSPVRITYANSFLLPVALVKFRVIEPLLRSPVESGVKPVPGWLNRSLGAALSCEAAWIASGRNLPLGQSLFAICRKNAA